MNTLLVVLLIIILIGLIVWLWNSQQKKSDNATNGLDLAKFYAESQRKIEKDHEKLMEILDKFDENHEALIKIARDQALKTLEELHGVNDEELQKRKEEELKFYDEVLRKIREESKRQQEEWQKEREETQKMFDKYAAIFMGSKEQK